MRTRSIVIGLLSGLLVACGGAADEQPPIQAPPPPAPPAPVADTPPPPAPTASAPAPKPSLADLETAALASRVANANDPVKIAALYAPDATQWSPGSPEAKGRDAILKDAQDAAGSMSSFQMAFVRTWTKGNQVAAEFVATATGKVSGKPWGVDGISLYTFSDDGLITQDRTYFDFETMMRQTGLDKDGRPFRPIAALPTTPAEAHVAKGDEVESGNVANEQAFRAAWLKGDDAAQLAFLSDAFVSNDNTLSEPKDKKWAKDDLALAKKSSKDRAWKDLTLFGVEDFTIDDGEATSTQTGDFVHGKIKVPNKHKTTTTHALVIDQWKDGKIVKEWSWRNAMELDGQLGIAPKVPTADAKTKPAPAAKTTTAKPPAK
jgi:ketosteroid isomerase-like protein